jgi:hypothetical protein
MSVEHLSMPERSANKKKAKPYNDGICQREAGAIERLPYGHSWNL